MQTGPDHNERGGRCDRAGFTLIELILVLSLLAVISSFVAPALARFARGRSLDGEARQVLALTRAAQSRAVSDGTPILLSIDPAAGTYSMTREWARTLGDPKAMSLRVDETLRVDTVAVAGPGGTMTGGAGAGVLRSIRFMPDGTVDEASPQGIRVADIDGRSLMLVQTKNRMGYEIRTDIR